LTSAFAVPGRSALCRGDVYYHPYTEEGPYASEKEVGETGLPEKGVMKFKFDYGDCWRFELRLEKIETPLPKNARVTVLEAWGKRRSSIRRENNCRSAKSCTLVDKIG
jgi:hypothetical protein